MAKSTDLPTLPTYLYHLLQFIKLVMHNVSDAPSPQCTPGSRCQIRNPCVSWSPRHVPSISSMCTSFCSCMGQRNKSTIPQLTNSSRTWHRSLGLSGKKHEKAKVFVKRHPNAFLTWPHVHLCQQDDFLSKFHLRLPEFIARHIKDFPSKLTIDHTRTI